MDDISNFLSTRYPDYECILVGCRSQLHYKSYECCEYDIILLKPGAYDKFDGGREKNKLLPLNDKNLRLMFYNVENFAQNNDINFQHYIRLTNSTFKYHTLDYFNEKKLQNQKKFPVYLKRHLFQMALDCTSLIKQLSKNILDQNSSSFYVKMLSFEVLKSMIVKYHHQHPSPSHLKYQINELRDNIPRIKTAIDLLSNSLEIERSNVSTVSRSSKSLMSLLEISNINNMEMNLFQSKLSFFMSKSMYVDGNLLLHSFIQRQNFNYVFIDSYKKLLNLILDTQIQEKSHQIKELYSLFDLIKNLIKNSY